MRSLDQPQRAWEMFATHLSKLLILEMTAMSRTAGGQSSFSGWPDAQWPEFSQSTLKAAGARAPLIEAVHMGEDAPATPALNYRIRTTSSEPRCSRSSSPGELHPSEPQIDAGRRGAGKGELFIAFFFTFPSTLADSQTRTY